MGRMCFEASMPVKGDTRRRDGGRVRGATVLQRQRR